MDTPSAIPARVKPAADMVTEFAIISLQEQFLRWEKDVNMHIAEMVWNGCSMGLGPGVIQAGEPDLKELVDTLVRARKARWGDETFLVFGLDVRVEDGEMVFSFDLTWDDGETFQPCEIVWDVGIAPKSAFN
jgi:hypothetical protein